MDAVQMYQLGSHFRIGLVYCLHMYTFILFNIIPITEYVAKLYFRSF